jgi:23S rRNA (adenine2030-N6)-methyltransferase
MNYKHSYHAGNFADVAKHVALLACLDTLKRKVTPFMVLDTHAGRGVYDLKSPEARKSQEAERGILALIERAHQEPSLQAYFTAIGVQAGRRLGFYPGSPALICGALRAQDRAVFVELMPAEARAIARETKSLGHTGTLIEDGYAALKAHLPPAERRGLVLLDPPYENPDELKILLKSLNEAYRRWPTGIFLIWYPIRSAVQRRSFHARFEALQIPKMLYADLALHPDDAGIGLAGSGLIIVNPPFGIDEYLREAYSAIYRHIAAAGGYVEIARLTGESIGR